MKKERKGGNSYRNDYRNLKFTIGISMAKRLFSTPKLFIPRKGCKPDVNAGVTWYIYFYWKTDPNGTLILRKNRSRFVGTGSGIGIQGFDFE